MRKRTVQSDIKTNATANYWSQRLKRVDPLAAVLTYNAPRAINQAYDRWERESLKANLPSLKHKKALDLGCGIGRITLELAKAGAQVTAVDISGAMLSACRRRASRAGVSDRIELIESPMYRLPDNLGKFDVVTCFGLLEHLTPAERRACLSSAFGCLRKRGRMLVVVNNAEGVYLRRRKGEASKRFEGYYVSLVGLSWLEQSCRSQGMTLALLAANPFYAWLHYGVLGGHSGDRVSDREIRRRAEQVCDLDLAFPLDGPAPLNLASHFMVEIRRQGDR